MVFKVTIGALSIPIFDVATVASCFYVGLQESKGIDMGPLKEAALTYGPTTLTVLATPFQMKLAHVMYTGAAASLRSALSTGDISLKDKTKLKDLEPKKRAALEEKIHEQLAALESLSKTPPYMAQTARAGAITVTESVIGYVAGRMCGHFL